MVSPLICLNPVTAGQPEHSVSSHAKVKGNFVTNYDILKIGLPVVYGLISGTLHTIEHNCSVVFIVYYGYY